MVPLVPRSQLRRSAAAPEAYGVEPLVPPKTRSAVSEPPAVQFWPKPQPLLAVSVLVGAWMSGLNRLSGVGPRLWLATWVWVCTSMLPTPITRWAEAGELTVLALGPLFPLAAITTAPASKA